MSRRVPRGGPGAEWPNEPDEGQAYGDQGAQPNGYGPNGYNGYNGHNGNGHGAPGRDQQQYGRRPGRGGAGGPGGYGPQPPRGQGGNGYGQQGYGPPGYGPPGYQPGPPPGQGQGQGYDNQPTQTFNYQGGGAAHQGNGDPRGHQGYNGDPRGYNGDPRGYPGGGGQGNMRRYEEPQRFGDQRYEVPGQGPGGPALLDETSADVVPARKVRLRRTRRFFRRRSVRVVSALVGAVPRLRDVLRRAGGVQEQRPGRVREPGGVGQGPLPRPGRDVRRVGVLQPAAEGRQAVVLPRRAERRGAQPRQAGEGQGQERVRARHPGRR